MSIEVKKQKTRRLQSDTHLRQRVMPPLMIAKNTTSSKKKLSDYYRKIMVIEIYTDIRFTFLLFMCLSLFLHTPLVKLRGSLPITIV